VPANPLNKMWHAIRQKQSAQKFQQIKIPRHFRFPLIKYRVKDASRPASRSSRSSHDRRLEHACPMMPEICIMARNARPTAKSWQHRPRR
jgi:hypothetical protein